MVVDGASACRSSASRAAPATFVDEESARSSARMPTMAPVTPSTTTTAAPTQAQIDGGAHSPDETVADACLDADPLTGAAVDGVRAAQHVQGGVQATGHVVGHVRPSSRAEQGGCARRSAACAGSAGQIAT